MNSARARSLRRSATWAEKLVWRWLKNRRFHGWKFRRQHPVGPYCLDFFCEEARLAIELDGFQHYSTERRCRDERRDEFLRSRTLRSCDAQTYGFGENERSFRPRCIMRSRSVLQSRCRPKYKE